MVSFFLVGPDNTLQGEINKIKTNHEHLNPHADVDVEIISETTEGCAVGTTMYYYRVNLKEKED